MKLKIREIGGGLHPSEVIVEIDTAEGTDKLVIDSASIQGSAIEVGFPVGKRNGHFLVELPAETSRGKWRVWVAKNVLTDGLENVA